TYGSAGAATPPPSARLGPRVSRPCPRSLRLASPPPPAAPRSRRPLRRRRRGHARPALRYRLRRLRSVAGSVAASRYWSRRRLLVLGGADVAPANRAMRAFLPIHGCGLLGEGGEQTAHLG